MLGLGGYEKGFGPHPKGFRNSTDKQQHFILWISISDTMAASQVHPVAFCSLSNIKESRPVQFKHQSLTPFRPFIFSAVFTAKE